MKTKNLSLTVVFILSLLISCKKDKHEDSLTATGKFTYDGKEYPLDKGYIHHDIGTSFNVSFFSSGVTVITNGGALHVDGKGEGFILTLVSTIPTDLSSATYKWPAQTTAGSEMIIDAQMGRSNDITNSISGGFRSATYGTGSVTVSKSSLQYTIVFSFLIDGKTASGQYIGTLEDY